MYGNENSQDVSKYSRYLVYRVICRDLSSSGVLRNVEWYSFTDVSGQRIGFMFKVIFDL